MRFSSSCSHRLALDPTTMRRPRFIAIAWRPRRCAARSLRSSPLARRFPCRACRSASCLRAASAPFAYGCGFALVGGEYTSPSLTTLPLDGRTSLRPAGAMGAVSAWPYDPHGVAFASYSLPSNYAVDASQTCSASLFIAFDDGRPSITRAYNRDCVSLLGSVGQGAAVYRTGFGG